ncbi:MAG TPA: hypothetical protein PKC98_25850, partial [Candidatus Melainabacteria bacterium]|nr:hypothetical protein [Candidatus Melainabacteria bacterium]
PFFDLSPAQPEKLPSEGSPPELPPRAIPAPMKDPLLPGAIPEKSISAPAGGDVRPLNQAP